MFRNSLRCCSKKRKKKRRRNKEKKKGGEFERENVFPHCIQGNMKLAGNSKDSQYPQAAFLSGILIWALNKMNFPSVFICQNSYSTRYCSLPSSLWHFHKYIRITCLIIYSSLFHSTLAITIVTSTNLHYNYCFACLSLPLDSKPKGAALSLK